MKKLLIALASAAAITGAAKAAGSGVGHTTTFEALQIGSAFNAALDDDGTGTGGKYWAIAQGADDNYATVTNVNFKGTEPSTTTNNSQKALAIDTSARLSRQVNPGSEGAESFTNSCLYFDGYVQFTAADSLPTTEAGDKLVVWLYGGDEDTDDAVTNALGLATKSATNLVITAGVLSDGVPTRADFLVTTGAAAIAPDTWHRLTIKAFTEEIDSAQIPMFKVYLDGTQLSAGNTEKFPSLVAYNSEGGDQFTLTSVSFEGTGAVDDLGFTAVDLFPEAQPFDYAVTICDEDDTGATATYAVDGTSVSLVNGVLKVNPSATTVTFVVAVAEGYKLANTGATKGVFDSVSETYAWTLNVAVSSLAKDGNDAITLTVVEDDGAATTYELTLTAGDGTTLTAKKTSDNSPINTGTYLPEGTEIIITAAISDDTAYENLVVTVGGSQVVLNANGEYTFTIGENTKVVASSATAIQPADWPADPTTVNGQTAGTAYGITGDLANADAGALATWAKANSVSYSEKGGIITDAFLLNCANSAAAVTAAKANFKVTAIAVNGTTVTITPADGSKYGNGKVVVQGSATLIPADSENWHAKTSGDHFFRLTLVVDEVSAQN